MKVVIERVYLETETLGSWYLGDAIYLLAKTMELPWKENAKSISCIPEGEYKMVREKYTIHHPYPHFRILDVKDRTGILVHKITYVKDLKGCIGVGSEFADLNKDGVPDIMGSTIALDKLYRSHDDSIDLIIRKKL